MSREQTFTRLRELLVAGDYRSLVALAEARLAEHPGDLSAAYCAGIALCLDRRAQDGLACLLQIVGAFCQHRDRMADRASQELVGEIALQMATMAEFYRVPNLERTCALGARTASLIGRAVGNERMAQRGEAILRRRWTRPDGGGEDGYLRPESPIVLQVEPTNRCNLRCTMCPRRRMTRPEGTLDPGLFRELLSGWSNVTRVLELRHLVHDTRIVESGGRGVKLFFMGEPLLHRGIGELVTVARELGCHVAIQTNGVLLVNPKVRRRLLDAAPRVISVSVDGLSAGSYETIRSGSTWERIVEGITTLHREREEMGLADAIRIEVTTIQPEMSEAYRARARRALEPILPLLDTLRFNVLSRHYQPTFCTLDDDMQSFAPGEPAPPPPGPLCWEPLTKLNVLWSGEVTPCCYDINGTHPLGDARESTIDAIWNGERTLALHRALVDHAVEEVALCRACRGPSRAEPDP